VQKFWKRSREDALAGELRARRPEPRTGFVGSLAQRIEAERDRVHHRSFRPAVAASFTVVLLVAIGAFGGAGYAASVQHQVSHVANVFKIVDVANNPPAVSQQATAPSTSTQVATTNGHGDDGHHGGGGDDGHHGEDGHHGGHGDGDDDDQYRPGRGCGDKNHVHDRHNECHHHGHGHGHHPGDDNEQ
jgi:hypothetical protein